MEQKKKIADMTKEERAAYQRDWYNKKVGKAPVTQTLHLEIHNAPDELIKAIMNALESK